MPNSKLANLIKYSASAITLSIAFACSPTTSTDQIKPQNDPDQTSNYIQSEYSPITTSDQANLLWAYGAPQLAKSITSGGASGEIVRVTSLASEGPGTLREALAKEGAKTIVFEVGGAINLNGNNLVISNPNVTIAGQTAPSPGISILRGGLIIKTNDVIVQHIRIRPGDLNEAPRSGRDIDAITTIAASNVVVDHCSLTWATDENLSASGPRFTGDSLESWRQGTSHNILYSHNIIAEGLSNSTHAKGEHSKGSLIHDNVNKIYLYGNLYSSNMERSPLFKGGVQGSLINNFIYNPGQRAVHYNLQGLEWAGHDPVLGRMDLIGNAMKEGPSTQAGLPLLMIAGVGNLSAYLAGNTSIDRWGQPMTLFGKYSSNDVEIIKQEKPHFSTEGLAVFSSSETEEYVLANAGARPWDRDLNDVRVLADAAEGRGSIINSQEDVGGYPVFEETRSSFDPANWNLELMTPSSLDLLDNSAHAKGT